MAQASWRRPRGSKQSPLQFPSVWVAQIQSKPGIDCFVLTTCGPVSKMEFQLEMEAPLRQDKDEGIEMSFLVSTGPARKTSTQATCHGSPSSALPVPSLPTSSIGTSSTMQRCQQPAVLEPLPFLHSPERYVTDRPIADDVEVHASVLGQGSYAKVQSATCLRTGQQLAVKTLWRTRMSEQSWRSAQQEAQIHLSMDHPNIVRLHRVYDEGSAMHLVMERLEGGELFYRLLECKQFSEKEASDIALQVLSAVAYMHAQGVVHRDLKLENIIYVAKDSPHVKLIDFGFAARLDDKQRLQEACGSLQYLAPEVLKRSYNEKVDIWSIGSIMYTLLTSQSIFRGTDKEVLRKTVVGKPDFSRRFFILSESARHFISSLLATSPTKRLSASEAVKHTWLHSVVCDEVAAATNAVAIKADGHSILLQRVREYLRTPQPRQMKLLALVAWSLPAKSEIELRSCFAALADVTRGVITPASLRSAAAGCVCLGGSKAEEEALLFNEVASLLEEASSSSQGTVQGLGWSQLLAASLISELIKLPEEEANSQTSGAGSCKHACGSSSDSGEKSGGSTRIGSLVDGIMPCPSDPSLLGSTIEPTFGELACRTAIETGTGESSHQTMLQPTYDEWSHEIVPEGDVHSSSHVKVVAVENSPFNRQKWAGCWSPLGKLLFRGR
mmetsp:Transcript_134423/g.268274  ORF Transcript_134423/g.268274 Transcript_134423/m.268274 type:complete len:669 (+) Transcript_134423:3-2009(+)